MNVVVMKKRIFASFALCLVESVHQNRELWCSAHRGLNTLLHCVSWGSAVTIINHTRLFHWRARWKGKLWKWINYVTFKRQTMTCLAAGEDGRLLVHHWSGVSATLRQSSPAVVGKQLCSLSASGLDSLQGGESVEPPRSKRVDDFRNSWLHANGGPCGISRLLAHLTQSGWGWRRCGGCGPWCPESSCSAACTPSCSLWSQPGAARRKQEESQREARRRDRRRRWVRGDGRMEGGQKTWHEAGSSSSPERSECDWWSGILSQCG